MKLAIYKSVITSPFGKFLIAVESNSYDARQDMRTAALTELRCHNGLLRIGDVTKSSRQLIKSMDAIKSCGIEIGWSWIKKLK